MPLTTMTTPLKPRWDPPKPAPLPNWNSTEGLRLQGADPGLTPMEECRHDWHKVGRCRSSAFKCHWCGKILVETDP